MKLVRSCTRHPLLQYPADVTRLTTNTHTHACVNMRARTHTHICVHHIPLTSTSVFLAKTLISRTFYSSQTRTQNDMYTCSPLLSLSLSLSLSHTHTHTYLYTRFCVLLTPWYSHICILHTTWTHKKYVFLIHSKTIIMTSTQVPRARAHTRTHTNTHTHTHTYTKFRSNPKTHGGKRPSH